MERNQITLKPHCGENRFTRNGRSRLRYAYPGTDGHQPGPPAEEPSGGSKNQEETWTGPILSKIPFLRKESNAEHAQFGALESERNTRTFIQIRGTSRTVHRISGCIRRAKHKSFISEIKMPIILLPYFTKPHTASLTSKLNTLRISELLVSFFYFSLLF